MRTLFNSTRQTNETALQNMLQTFKTLTLRMQSWTFGGTGSLVPRPSHVFQRCTQKVWSIMWRVETIWDAVWNLHLLHILYTYQWLAQRQQHRVHVKRVYLQQAWVQQLSLHCRLPALFVVASYLTQGRPNQLSSMTKRAGGSQFNDDCWTRHTRVTELLCYYCRSVYTQHSCCNLG